MQFLFKCQKDVDYVGEPNLFDRDQRNVGIDGNFKSLFCSLQFYEFFPHVHFFETETQMKY
jgi:hypothetical protein